MDKKSYSYFSILWNVKSTGLVIAFCSVLYFTVNSIVHNEDAIASMSEQNSCKCVVFRFDDVRNGYLEIPQIALMDYFISNNESVTLGLIMKQMHSETDLHKKIQEGYKKGLFELGIHGWDHIDYTGLSENEQRLSLVKANQKMHALFGNYSRIFIPPFNLFNSGTISAMGNFHFNVLSSAIYYDHPDIQGSFSNSDSKNGIFHMPEMTDFSIYYNGTWVKVPIKFILSDIDFNIKTYGYSVVMIHPHNFAIQVNGSLIDVADYNQIKSLNSIIKAIQHKNIQITTFSEVAANR